MSSSINIIVLSDAHGKLDSIEKILNNVSNKVDLIIYCGDIAPYRQHFDTIKYITKLINYAEKFNISKILAVPGNVDNPKHYFEASINNDIFMNLHENFYMYKEYVFVGFGGSNITPFNTFFENTEDTIEKKLAALLENINNRNKIILTTHAPPYNSKCDVAYSGQHIGSTAIRNIIERFKPILVLSGHVHESRCIDKIGNTTIINPGPMSKGYYAMVKLGDIIEANLSQVY
ncbi:MAG: metallophosphoesterase [Ignisphaera sp.]